MKKNVCLCEVLGVVIVDGHDPVVIATVEEDTASVFSFGDHLPVYTVS